MAGLTLDVSNGAGPTPAAAGERVPPGVAPWPVKPKRRLTLDAETYVESVRQRLRSIEEDQDRTKWRDDRERRYAKYRGWLEEKTTPWAGAANAHIPIMQIASLRANAGLHNVILSLRPLLNAKGATGRRDLTTREEHITALIDAQLFADPGPARAERVFGDYVSSFLEDGNAVAYTPWVHDVQTRTACLYRPPVPPGEDYEGHLIRLLQAALPGFDELSLRRTPDTLNVYTGTFRLRPDRAPSEFTVTVFQDEGGYLDLELQRPVTVYDGPVMLPLALEALHIPTRCENLQPPSAANPHGAPYVFLDVTFTLDQVRRFQADGTFNWLTEEALDAIEADVRSAAGGTPLRQDTDRLAAQKDAMEGQTHTLPPVSDDADLVHLPVACVIGFDRWGIGDGDAEHVYTILAKDQSGEVRWLLEARRLSERCPGDRPWRPLADAICIPVPGRWYGIGLLELGEQLYDLVAGMVNQALDSGTISSIPFFLYAASAKLDPGRMLIAPGEGFPVPGSPKETVYFPSLGTRDQSFAFQMITLALQLFERLMMIGDLQLGRVPTGKASALRTVGTTMAILQQGDVRADQLLLRLLSGLQQVATHFHRLNRQFLPPGKEIRRVGWDGERAKGYLAFEQGHADIDDDMDFELRPDFLQANPQVLASTLQTAMALTMTPLGFETGVATPEEFYRLLRDWYKASRLDPKMYLHAPRAEPGEPVLAEEAISRILSGQAVTGPPMEGPEAHLETLNAFIQSPEFGYLNGPTLELFRAHWAAMQARRQRSQLAQAAGQHQEAMAQVLGSSATGASGAETAGQAPEITTQTPTAAEQASPTQAGYGPDAG